MKEAISHETGHMQPDMPLSSGEELIPKRFIHTGSPRFVQKGAKPRLR